MAGFDAMLLGLDAFRLELEDEKFDDDFNALRLEHETEECGDDFDAVRSVLEAEECGDDFDPLRFVLEAEERGDDFDAVRLVLEAEKFDDDFNALRLEHETEECGDDFDAVRSVLEAEECGDDFDPLRFVLEAEECGEFDATAAALLSSISLSRIFTASPGLDITTTSTPHVETADYYSKIISDILPIYTQDKKERLDHKAVRAALDAKESDIKKRAAEIDFLIFTVLSKGTKFIISNNGIASVAPKFRRGTRARQRILKLVQKYEIHIGPPQSSSTVTLSRIVVVYPHAAFHIMKCPTLTRPVSVAFMEEIGYSGFKPYMRGPSMLSMMKHDLLKTNHGCGVVLAILEYMHAESSVLNKKNLERCSLEHVSKFVRAALNGDVITRRINMAALTDLVPRNDALRWKGMFVEKHSTFMAEAALGLEFEH